ncbi:Ankyrin repeat [Cognatiyoonia koreensis]|uniref:Ankyrin repeat n=1 Tax=Cognatiyoonia koreensis TaxID=364200 RepID=A0A1I0RWM5_9RHOB|nr:ankyrin repeat domain-containing protein [Cognatiyoonia koreensis]SEW45940.1 Ankyrin repeat [Cognatiyoonia koreensis]
MPVLPARPSLEHLKKQAKRLLRSARANDLDALAQVGPYFGDPSQISLQQAQLVIARDHGFSSWTKLKHHVEAGSPDASKTEQRANYFLDLACLHYGPDNTRGPQNFADAAEVLRMYPEIARHSVHTAAAVGDVEALREMVAEDPRSVDRKGGPFQWTPLMYAAYARLPYVSTYPAGQVLLDAGADPNAHYMWGGTYRFSVLTGIFGDGEGGKARLPEHPEMVRFARAVLDKGANPNDSQGAYNRCFSPDNTHLELMLEYGLKDSDPSDWWLTEPDRNPADHRTMHFQLIIALRWGYADRARLLIDHGVDINSPDNNYYPTYTVGYTPYQVALMRGMPEIAALIKAKGGRADPLDGRQAFQASCMQGDFETASRLAVVHLGAEPDTERELLREAAGNGNLAAVQTMIRLGFELSRAGTRTPLHVAAINGHVEVIRALIDAGADTAMRDPDYNTPPFVHAMHGLQDEAAAILVASPMDIFAAAAMGRKDLVESALSEDATLVHARFRSVRTGPQERHERDWATPLWFAAVNGKTEVVQMLLDRGADPTIADDEGRTIVEYAKDEGHGDIVALLQATAT